jgi:hypothetical protein
MPLTISDSLSLINTHHIYHSLTLSSLSLSRVFPPPHAHSVALYFTVSQSSPHSFPLLFLFPDDTISHSFVLSLPSSVAPTRATSNAASTPLPIPSALSLSKPLLCYHATPLSPCCLCRLCPKTGTILPLFFDIVGPACG